MQVSPTPTPISEAGADPPEIDETIDWEADTAREIDASSQGYVSPLMQRVSTARITIELLRKEVPVIHAGNDAAATLKKATSRMGEATRARLAAKEQAGKDAKQRLYEAALPLIHVAAKRELARRQQWGSSITLEDLVQEATVGFLKGINSFKVEAIRRSPTNYLGQWILVEMRRASESLDHDMQVGHDAGEKFRRVRALRNRLITALGREPTDEEIAEASRNLDYVVRPGFVGKAPAAGESVAAGKGLTVAQIREERKFRGRLGHAVRIHTQDSGDHSDHEQGGDLGRLSLATNSDLNPDTENSPDSHITEVASANFVAQVVAEALALMNLPVAQREVIAQRFGIPPHSETSAREIAKRSGIQRERVTRVLQAFQVEMTRPGGAFHQALSTYSDDDIYASGLGWALKSLGPWRGPAKMAPNPILIADISPTSGTTRNLAPTDKGPAKRATQVSVQFHCEFHRRTFAFIYPTARHAPQSRECPVCGSSSQRVGVTPMD